MPVLPSANVSMGADIMIKAITFNKWDLNVNRLSPQETMVIEEVVTKNCFCSHFLNHGQQAD